MAAKLPGFNFCSSPANVKHWLAEAGFRNDPSKWRVVTGVGVRKYEYHVSLITQEQQEAWRRYCGGSDQTQDAEKVPDHDPAPENLPRRSRRPIFPQ
jgi:hypothetical protein